VSYAQYTSNVQIPICITENTKESQSAISNTFQNDMEMQNPYQSKSRHRRPEPLPASLPSPVYDTSYLSGTVKAICY
jgi:hypothetical protein